MMLKLKLQYFGHLMWRADSLEKTLMLGGIGGRRRRGRPRMDGWMVSRTRWMWVWVNSGRWWWTGRPGELQFMGSQRVGHDWVTELNWTECKHHLTNIIIICLFIHSFYISFPIRIKDKTVSVLLIIWSLATKTKKYRNSRYGIIFVEWMNN